MSLHRKKRSERGAAMVESLLAMFVIFLFLFGFLQVIYFFIGQYFADYAALRGARSRCVGFPDDLVKLEARVNAIGASGQLRTPNLDSWQSSKLFPSKYKASRFAREKILIQRYVVGLTYIDYEYWYGHSSDEDRQVKTTFSTYFPAKKQGMTSVASVFKDYAFCEQLTQNLFFGRGIDLRGSASLADYSKVYLELGF